MKFCTIFLLLISCETYDASRIDQCLRREIYKECLGAAPKDKEPWTKIVDKCSTLSEYQATRRVTQIKPECRP